MREYAERRGVSHSSVSRAVRSGRLSLSVVGEGRGRKIDPELADREWHDNTNHAKRPPGSGGDAADQQIEGVPAGVSNAEARAAKEWLAARRLQLEVAELEQRLVDRQEQYAAGYDIGRRVQKALLSAVDRIAPLGAGQEEHVLKALMLKEITECLEALAGLEPGEGR